MKLMIIDDDLHIREGIQYGIDWETLGITEVVSYSNGIQAYQEFEVFAPDIILSDIRMPGMDGLELLKLIREKDSNVCFIVLSAYPNFEYCQKALRSGANDYEVKPIKVSRLIQVISKNIELIKKGVPSAVEEDHKKYSGTVCKVMEYIEGHYKEAFTIDMIAALVNKTPNYLSAIFKKEVGCVYSDYILDLRMKEAERLVVTTSIPIQDISNAVGYSDYAYFSRLFRKTFGCSASQVRKNEKYNSKLT